MPNPHPLELRERAVRAYEAGEGSYTEVATTFAISRRSLQRWTERQRRTGDSAARAKGGGQRSPVHWDRLREIMAADPDGTTGELTQAYNRGVGRSARVHRSSILRALHRAGYVFKKNGRGRSSRIAPSSGANAPSLPRGRRP